MEAKHRIALAAAAVAALSMQGYAYYRWSHPDLTVDRVIAELGEDELRLSFAVEPDDPMARTPCGTERESRFHSEGRAAALAAGWIERACPDDPNRMRLTADGRARSARWTTFPFAPHELPLAPHTRVAQTWSVTVARYERTGPPRIGPREAFEGDTPRPLPAHRVLIPGHWVPNEDGQRLYEAGWAPIRVVDRVERYTFWEGLWAREHGGS